MEVLLLTTDSSSPFAIDTKKAAKKMPLLRMADEERDRTCARCGKVLATPFALQKHKNKVFLCDQRGVRRHTVDMRITSSIHRCRRCGKALSSAAGLRYHMAKTSACDARQSVGHQKLLPPVLLKRKDSITKILRSPVPSQDLRMHLSRPSPLVNSEPVLLDQGGAKTLNLSKSDKAPPAKISLDEYLSMLKNKQRQPTQKPLVTRAAVSRGNNSKATIAGSNALLIKRKRNTEDNREEMSPIGESNKRVCSGSFTTLAAHISKRCSSPDSHQSKPVSCKPTNATTTSTISYQKRKPDHVHGGNILTDGCCCRQCVRKWTCKMMNRLKFLGDEVTSLRQLVRLGRHSKLSFQPSTTTTPPASADKSEPVLLHSRNENQYCAGKTKLEPLVISTSTSVCNIGGADVFDSPSAEDSVIIKLIEKYNHLNDQILTNERALEDSVAHLKEISQHSETSSSELHTQLDELRVYIGVEKIKRDEAVAAVIAQRWSAKKNEFGLLLESMTAKSKPRAEKAFHEECAEIAGQLNKIISSLGGLTDREKSSSVKNGSDIPIPKHAVERTAKSFLERQRDDIFMFLIRSSPRIHLLTKVKLDETIKET
ncbi:hypothetical protein PC128_g860 [Phytophthora cactorum]|nr:hypothetical protein PC120_g11182 [Phytophthora cactorum]KAG3206324.1 hypothetical protein PC128_g860 [Phytophthora cactorum]KAG4064204.1 hypothetical protein PC123_g1001 [Phytophthora cactorum]